MKFVLTYDGHLPSAGNASSRSKEKWEIRKKFHPQLAELWQRDPILKSIHTRARIPSNGGWWQTEQHHSAAPPEPTEKEGRTDLCAPLSVGGKIFIPLVRESMALVCSLHILFLRKEEAGSLLKVGGDLDNRIKTLFDALRVPTKDESQAYAGEIDQPMYCLLEDDSLITNFTIETNRLLTKPESSESEVKLIITATIGVTQVRSYNSPFMGV